MDNNNSEFDEIEGVAADRRRQQGFDDLQNEMKGDEVGRVPRFLSAEARQILLDKRNGKQSVAMTALDLALMNNPEFAAAYEQAMDTLSEVEDIAERVLRRLETHLIDLEVQLKDAQAEYQTTLNNAAVLDDGTKVFRDAKGKVWDEHGKPVVDNVAASIEWSGLEPSYETHRQQRQSIDDLIISIQETKNSIHEIRVYQTDVLGNVRADLTNPNHSGSVEDVKAAEDRILDRMPEALRDEYKPHVPELDAGKTSTFSVAEPNLGS